MNGGETTCSTFRHHIRFLLTYRSETWSHSDLVAKRTCATSDPIIFACIAATLRWDLPARLLTPPLCKYSWTKFICFALYCDGVTVKWEGKTIDGKNCWRCEESRVKSASDIRFIMISSLLNFHRDRIVIWAYDMTVWWSYRIQAAFTQFRITYFSDCIQNKVLLTWIWLCFLFGVISSQNCPWNERGWNFSIN